MKTEEASILTCVERSSSELWLLELCEKCPNVMLIVYLFDEKIGVPMAKIGILLGHEREAPSLKKPPQCCKNVNDYT